MSESKVTKLVWLVIGGVIGGARATQQLKLTLLATVTRVLPWPEVFITFAGSKIADGKLTDPDSLKFGREAVRALLAEVQKSRGF